MEVLFTPGLWVPLVRSFGRGLCSHACAAIWAGCSRTYPTSVHAGGASPTQAALLPSPALQVCIQGTYILPGIPRLFQQMVEAHADRFRGPAAFSSTLYTNLGEGEAGLLPRGVAAAHVVV